MSRNAAREGGRLLAERASDAERRVLRVIERSDQEHLEMLFRTTSTRSFRLVGVGIAGAAACRRHRKLTPFLLSLVAILTAHASGAVLRHAIGRRRPSDQNKRIAAGIEQPASSSLPSTHAATAFAAAVVLGQALPEVRLPLLVGASVVSASRVWLRVHYPTDVLLGAGIGSIVGFGVVKRHDWRLRP